MTCVLFYVFPSVVSVKYSSSHICLKSPRYIHTCTKHNMTPSLFSISLLIQHPERQTVWYMYASRKCLQRQEAHTVRPFIAGIPGCVCVYLAWADFPKTLYRSRPAQCGSACQQDDTMGNRQSSCRQRSTSSEKCGVNSCQI